MYLRKGVQNYFILFGRAFHSYIKTKCPPEAGQLLILRRERDSNPRTFWVNGFQDRRIRPLCHLSGAKILRQGLSAKLNLNIYNSNIMLSFRIHDQFTFQ